MAGGAKVLSQVVALMLLSSVAFGWGQIGHKASGYVAEAYLTPKSKQILQQLLRGQRLADVASWADTLRGDDRLKHTSSYHYENVDNGIQYLDYLKQLPQQQIEKGGVVQAILVAERELEDAKVPMAQKEVALKFLVHFIGDLHQPLHTGQGSDRGGNEIRVKWFGFDGSLHSVWDTGMILSGHGDIFSRRNESNEDQNMVYARFLLQSFGHQRQPETSRDNPGVWMTESLQTRNFAYDPNYNRNQEAYQDKYLAILDQRVFAAGLRIADVLNRIFENAPPPPSQLTLVQQIEEIVGSIESIITLGPRKNDPRERAFWH